MQQDTYKADPWESVECRTQDPDIWFLEDDIHSASTTNTDNVEFTALALTICNRCPMRLECLEMGMAEENIRHGIWGGLLPGERYILAGMTNTIAYKRRIHSHLRIRRLAGVAAP